MSVEVEGDSRPHEAKPDSPGVKTNHGSPATVRSHAITLCCGESVAAQIEEIARALSGLGFSTTVVTGSDAREALLGSERINDEPKIYVVCVQGALKDAVLGPLRQALATQGGPNEHLFVAVLDPALPLTMVGQVRRFASALERMRKAPRLGAEQSTAHERRQWRELTGEHWLDEGDTRTYRSVAEMSNDAKSAALSEADVSAAPSGRPSAPPKKSTTIEPTRRYRAVPIPGPALKKPAVNRRNPDAAASVGEPAVRRQVAVPKVEPAEDSTTEHNVAARPDAAKIGAAIAERQKSRARPMLVVLALATAGGAAAYFTGTLDSVLPPRFRYADAGPTIASASHASKEAAAKHVGSNNASRVSPSGVLPDSPSPDPQQDLTIEPGTSRLDVPMADLDTSSEHDIEDLPSDVPDALDPSQPELEAVPGQVTPDIPASDIPPSKIKEPDLSDVPPSPSDTPAKAPKEDDERSDADVAAALKNAIDRREVKSSKKYYATASPANDASWSSARRHCARTKINGIDDWRLPFRRELQLLGAIGMLDNGTYWSRTPDKTNEGFAFVYDYQDKQLSSREKSERAEVVCVRQRNQRK